MYIESQGRPLIKIKNDKIMNDTKDKDSTMTYFEKTVNESSPPIDEMKDLSNEVKYDRMNQETRRIGSVLFNLSYGNKFIYDDPVIKRIYVYLISNIDFISDYCDGSDEGINLGISTLDEIYPTLVELWNLCTLDKDNDEFKREYKSIVLNHCGWSEEDLKKTFEMDLGPFSYKEEGGKSL
jgi:hypothetical protein